VTSDIIPVRTAKLTRQFVEVPYALYARHPHWVPPLRRDEWRRVSPKHNPFFEHATMDMWIAQRNGRATGRIAAIEDRLHNDRHGERTTWFGFFEAVDQSTAEDLLRQVEHWGRARGSAVVRGPANPNLNESAGLLIDGFDEDPYVLMPYNPPEYARFVEDTGYAKVKDLLAWSLDRSASVSDRIVRIADRVKKRAGVVVRTANLHDFDREVAALQMIYRSAWAENWGFVPPTDAEITQLARDLRPVLDPEIALFAEIDGRPVGCAIAIPDMNQVLKRMRGRLLPFGVFHLLRRGAIINQARVLLVGVISDLRHTGLYPLLIAEIFRRGRARGYGAAELSWTLEDNVAVNAGIEAAGGRRSKTYRLYEKALGSDRGQTPV
jgi:hypothetical protein